MKSEFGKIIIGNVLRTALIALITCLVTRHVIASEVAAKIMRGDTVSLYNGSIGINLAMAVNVLVGLVAPILIPIGWGIWSRVVVAYQVVVARCEAFALSGKQLRAKTDQAGIFDKVRTVIAQEPLPGAP